jgi:hypothetical protein
MSLLRRLALTALRADRMRKLGVTNKRRLRKLGIWRLLASGGFGRAR